MPSVARLVKELRDKALEDFTFEQAHTASPWNYPAADKPKEIELPPFAWPGGYTIVYDTNQGSTLCAECATKAILDPDETDRPTEYSTYDEGPTIFCDGCNKELESSYGDPDEPEEDLTPE